MRAATINWTNTTSGGWNAPTNWNPIGVPGANDTAIITNAGVTVSLNGATTVGAIILGTNGAGTVALSLAGQTLSLNGPLTVNPSGSFTVNSGTLVGNTNAVLHGTIGWSAGFLEGILTLASGSTLNITTANNHDMPNCTFTNYGTVVWNGGDVRSGSSSPGTFIYNYGLWDAQSDQQLTTSGYNGNSVFNNFGTFRKSGGASEFATATTFPSPVVFNQLAGVLDVQNGTNGLQVAFQGGGNFTGGYITTNQFGLTVLSSGSFNLNGTVTGTNTWENSGNLVGTTLINGALTWVAGNWNGAPTATIPANSTLLITSANNHDMANCTLTNHGTVAWASGDIRSGSSSPGTFIYNYGLWDAQSDQQLTTSGYNGNTVFNNFATFRKSGGTNTSQTLIASFVLFNQPSGVLDVQQGNFTLQGSGNFNGGYITTNGTGTTYFSSGNFNLNGTATGTNVIENSGSLVGVNVINGALNWVAGSWDGITLTILSNSVVTVAGGGGNDDMANTVVTNYGTLAWASGTIRSGSSPGTFIYNYGLWDAQSDNTLTTSGYNGNTVFDNFGTFRKSGGLNASQTLFGVGVFLNQLAGAVDVRQGNLTLQGSGSFTGGTANNPAGTIYLSSGSFNINGTATANMIENSANLTGVNVINGGLSWVAGSWNGIILTVLSNSIVTIAGGGGNNDMANTVVTNYGTVVWTSGTIQSGSSPGTFIYNYGLWDVQSDQLLTTSGNNGTTVFNNFGTFRKEFTSGTTTFATGVAFNSTGEVDVLTGNLLLQSNASFPSGVLNIQAGNLLLQGGGNFTGVFLTTNRTGTIYLSGGDFNINGTVMGTNITENGGNLVGTNVINGALTWVNGDWNNAPSVTLSSNSVLLITSANDHDMPNCTVTNYGTVIWNGGDIRSGENGTTIYNYGLWDAQSDQQLTTGGYNGNSVFNNFGTFRKSGGASEFANATVFLSTVAFNQLAGAIDVQNGTNGLQLAFEGGGNFNGGYITTNNQGLTVLSSGSFNLNGTVTGTNTWEDGGNLVGTTVIRGALTWVNGNWNSAPTVAIPGNSTLLITSANNHDMANCTLTNHGTVAWASGDIRSGSSGTTIYNYGLWDAQSDQQLTTAGYNGNTVFNNFATFRKSGGTNTSQTLIASFVLFNQPSGVLDVQQGNFTLQGSGNFNGGYITTNSTGTTYLSQGSFNIDGTATGTNVIENAGSLVGTNVINGALNWVAGSWNGITLTILSNSVVTVSGGGGNNDMPNCTLTNYGTLAWASGDIRSGSSGTTIYNYGLWDAQSDHQLTTSGYNGPTVFNNFGALRKSSGNNASQTLFSVGVFLNQLAGAVDVRQGNLDLQGGGSLTGGTANNPAGTIYLSSGSFNINGTATANMIENSANLTGVNMINGGLSWVAGSWNGITLTILSNSLVTIVGGGGDNDMANCTLTNYGTLAWASGDIRGGSSGTFLYNYGLWDAQSDHVLTTSGYNGNVVFDNFGTFRKEFTSGTTTLATGVTFNNIGKMDAQSGNIALQGPYTLANGTKMSFGLNGPASNGQISLSGAASFAGSLSANFNDIFFWPVVGSSFTLLSYTSKTGLLFTNTVLPAFITWQTNYNPTTFTISVLARSTNPAPDTLYYSQPSPTNLFFKWRGDHTGWGLQTQTNPVTVGLTTNWVTIAGSGLTNEILMPIDKTDGSVFFRMVYP